MAAILLRPNIVRQRSLKIMLILLVVSMGKNHRKIEKSGGKIP